MGLLEECVDLTKYFTLSVTHGFRLPQELDWQKLSSKVVGMTDVAVEKDMIELLSEKAAIRINHPLPTNGFMAFDLYFSRVPKKPGPQGETPAGILFTNRIWPPNTDVGWPTFRVALKRKDDLHGILVMKVRQNRDQPWQQLVASTPLRSYTWYYLVLSWGNAMSISIAQALHDGTRATIDNLNNPAQPSSPPEVQYFGIGRVDHPIANERQVWTEPSLAGTKIRLKGSCFKPILQTDRYKLPRERRFLNHKKTG